MKLKFSLILFLFSISSFGKILSTTSTSSIFFENGTCKCPNATVDDTATISGTTYTVVDDSTFQSQVSSGNVNLCTSRVTDMSGLFQDNSSFNSDISFWDTSSVTTMREMFQGALHGYVEQGRTLCMESNRQWGDRIHPRGEHSLEVLPLGRRTDKLCALPSRVTHPTSFLHCIG